MDQVAGIGDVRNLVAHWTGLTKEARNAGGLELSLQDYVTSTLQAAAIQGQITNRVQGTVPIGRGVWGVHELLVYPGSTLRGAANKSVDALQGTVLQLDDLAAETILRAYNTGVEVRNITIEDLTLSTMGSNVASGWLHNMSAVLATSDITFKNVTFYADGNGAPPQCWFKGTTFGEYACGLSFINCRVILFGTSGAIGYQLDSSNSTVWMSAPKFYLAAGAKGWYSRGSGSLQVDNALLEGSNGSPNPTTAANRSITGKVNISNGGRNLTLTDSSAGKFTQNDVGHPVVIAGKLDSWITGVAWDGMAASCYDAATAAAANGTAALSRYVSNTTRPYAGFHLIGNRGCTEFNTWEDEGFQNAVVLENFGDAGAFPVTFNDSVIQSAIRVINGDVKLNINGGRTASQVINVDALSQCEVAVDAGAVVIAETLFGKWLREIKIDDQIMNPGGYRINAAKSLNRPVYKVNVGQATGSPIYGQSTDPFSGWVNDTATSSGAGSYLDGGAQDWDARSIPFTIPNAVLNCFQYGGALEQTYSGLVPNAAYDVCVISGWNGASFDMTVKLNGAYVGTHKIGTALGVAAFQLVRRVFRGAADSTGKIVLLLESGGASLLNAVTVTRGPDPAVRTVPLVYRALLTQAAGAAPVAEVLENTLSGPIVWTRSGAGVYVGTLVGAFPPLRTGLLIRAETTAGSLNSAAIVRTSADVITVTTGALGGAAADSLLSDTLISVTVDP